MSVSACICSIGKFFKWIDLSETLIPSLHFRSNLTEQFKMCKIGIRDGLDPVQFVSGQFVDKNRLCIVHMQDKNRPYVSLSLYSFDLLIRLL
jgi:hypothetical protein